MNANEPVAWMLNRIIHECDPSNWAKEQYPDQDVIPLYTQDQLEEARKLGMQQERAMWNLSASTQQIMDTHPVKEQDGCGNCHACLVGVTEHGLPITFQRMILCPDCGNKRCPKASNHRYQCTESNEPNQRGSIYTHPVKELNDGGEPVKNATYWKRQYNLMATQNDNLKSGLYHANEQIKYFESQIEALKKKLNEAIDAEKDRRFE